MGVYRVKVEGRNKPILVKEESQAKAKDRVVSAELLKSEDLAEAMEAGETIWKVGDPFPADVAVEAPKGDA